MAKVRYPAIVERGEDGGYGVFFPDLDGCVTAGDSADEAAARAPEALALHLEGLAEVGEPIPGPSAIDAIERDPDINEVARLLVEAEEPKAGERVNVWLPKSLLSRIDRYVEEVGAGGSRSAFLAQAARQVLDAERKIPWRSSGVADVGRSPAQIVDEYRRLIETVDRLYKGVHGGGLNDPALTAVEDHLSHWRK
ncbi:hypothetical protein G3573_13110 [Caulobacter sp. 17J65-9]|nr:hypothetical protein [Caulobacter sp. 17J65-9]